MRRLLPAIASVTVLVACAEEPTAVSPPPVATPPSPALLELPDLEVRADGRDRFASCQNAPRLSYRPEAPLPKPPIADAGTDGGPVANAEHTIADLRKPFRECYQAGLRQGSPPAAKVIWQIDIGPDGAVRKVERGGFPCGLSEGTLSCLEGLFRNAHFDAPGGGGSKLQIPITFVVTATPQVPRVPSAVSLDKAALHECYATAIARAANAKASATFRVHDGDVKIDAWEGDSELLACAAAVLQHAGAEFSMKIRFEE